MSTKFEDDLRAIAPNIAQGTVTALEALYGASVGFCAGLDIFARIVMQNVIPTRFVAFGEPWKSIYADTSSILSNNPK